VLYYSGSVGGIEFNQEDLPSFTDFAYVAFTIGMTYQVSDTNLQSTQIRAAAFRHGLQSFNFGSVILAGAHNRSQRRAFHGVVRVPSGLCI
jgi:uncharacterized membrane protein